MSPLRLYFILFGAFAMFTLAGCTNASKQFQGGLSGVSGSYPESLATRLEPFGSGTYQVFNGFGSPVDDPQPITVTTSRFYPFMLEKYNAEAAFYPLEDRAVIVVRVRVGSAFQFWLARPLPGGEGFEALYADTAYIRWLKDTHPDTAFTKTELSPPFSLPSTVGSLNRRMFLDLASEPYLSLMKPAFTIRRAPAQTAAAQ